MPRDPLLDRLPAALAGRVLTVRRQHGRILLVASGDGLDAAARTRLEAELVAAAQDHAAGAAVHVAIGASEPAPAPPAASGSPVRPRIVAVGSGKGGVGKSTLTANLALALARTGLRVGIVDADIHGPSQPMLLGTTAAKPEAVGNRLLPVRGAGGVPVLSAGHLVPPGRALAWRGPMAGKALAQLVEADWGDTELLLADLPPGTGDIQITMLQRFRPAGAVIVSTPQDLALVDAARAGQMLEAAGVPIIGLVENMSGYSCPHCGGWSDPFGKGGIEGAAARMDIPFLGRIPLSIALREASDRGTPPAAAGGPDAEPFDAIARKVAQWLARP
ncbi:chromosome partitioning protein ParA [Erythrobacteraceae bacterium CFH 75059]|uniref:P-loop NTPase n=1 Tax=Qipengyuania thermophila TaxID=2509361 RepID=UPI00101FC679|nr:P-loop NTPase [Qipengyuania thermophila]TCD06402.1 chromosome partitioning protein ParA [Erythrobacteraceae bacterium CFH 75059]